MDSFLSWLLIVILVEIALVLFLVYRKAGKSCLLRLILSSMAFMALLMTVMSLAVLLGEGRRLDFADDDGPYFIGVAVVLAVFAVMLSRAPGSKADGVNESTPQGTSNRAEATPRRSAVFDLIGCALLGALALVALVVAIAAGIALAG